MKPYYYNAFEKGAAFYSKRKFHPVIRLYYASEPIVRPAIV